MRIPIEGPSMQGWGGPTSPPTGGERSAYPKGGSDEAPPTHGGDEEPPPTVERGTSTDSGRRGRAAPDSGRPHPGTEEEGRG